MAASHPGGVPILALLAAGFMLTRKGRLDQACKWTTMHLQGLTAQNDGVHPS